MTKQTMDDFYKNLNPEIAKWLKKEREKSEAQVAAFKAIDSAISDTDVPEGYQSMFPIPYSEDQLKKDIVSLYLIPFRYISLISGGGVVDELGTEILCRHINSPNLNRDASLIMSDDEYVGLTYEDVEDSMLAKTMIALYKYAYYGIDTLGDSEFTTDTSTNWYAVWIQDMADSQFNYEWNPSNEVKSAARRCFQAVEIANLRCILEGNEGFLSHDEAFNIRDMSLLSGMEEMSVRAAANPKRANPLATFKYKDGSTTVSLKEAKRWLISKKRYVPIREEYSQNPQDVDFETLKIKNMNDLQRGLADTYIYKKSQGQVSEEMQKEISRLGYDLENIVLILRLQENTPENLSNLAAILGVDETVFNIRLREILAKKLLQEAEVELERIKYLRLKNKK